MTDHSTSDEQLLLASAYVDGELTAEEQARAEADPFVMSMVDELRSVRRQLAIAAPPDEQRRNAAIGAALAAAPPIPSIAARRRARWMAPLAAAAAAVVVVVGGVALLRASDGGDDDAADQLSLQVTESAPLAEDDAASGAATAEAPQEATRAATSAAEAESGEVAAPEATRPASATEEQATAGAAPFVIVTEDDLRAFAVPAAADAASPTSVPLCRTDDRFVGFAQVQGVDGIVDVEIYDVAAPAERVAVDRQSCEVVLRATP